MYNSFFGNRAAAFERTPSGAVVGSAGLLVARFAPRQQIRDKIENLILG